ncbi:hypothetical protein [Frigidibacter sp. MR17.24]|uniref:hypothetical protein n=1 Tax=Frigidibacter sp. MR17.24 TaxID=3127345 RepID=UPI0030131C72
MKNLSLPFTLVPVAAAILLGLPGAAVAEGPPAPATATSTASVTVAADEVARLEALIAVPELLDLTREEGASYAEDVEAELFPGKGGASWIEEVRGLYDPARTGPVFDAAFRDVLAGRDTAPIAAFFGEGIGARAVPLEVSARRAMLDDDVEDDATLKAGNLMAARDPRFRSLGAFIEAGDLVEANVIGAMNANLAFWRGLSDGGAFPEPMAEEDMLDKVTAQVEDIRSETRDWLFAYFALAYAPLGEGELAGYTAFTASAPGQALNAAVFAGFDAVFTDVSYRMGLAAAQRIAGQDL